MQEFGFTPFFTITILPLLLPQHMWGSLLHFLYAHSDVYINIYKNV